MSAALVEPTLSSSFDAEKSAKISTSAAKALGDYRDQRAIPYLTNAWRRDRGFRVANQAVESIGKIGGNSGFTVIEKLYHEFEVDPHQEQWSRSSIVAALGYCMDDRTRPILLKELARRERLLPCKDVLIDAVNERAIEIKQEDRVDTHAISPILELRCHQRRGVRAFAHLFAPVIIDESDRLGSQAGERE
jgi:PBS lyase HEAT-like repeat